MTTAGLERAFASTRSVLVQVTPDQLSQPTPCQSWLVRDLINHFVEVSLSCAETTNTGVGPPPLEVDFTQGDMVATYDDGIVQAVAAFNAPGAIDKTLTLPFGSIPASVYLHIITTDAFTHGWDLARALRLSTDLDPELAATLLETSRTFVQPTFRGEDGVRPFGPEQPAPPGATNADALAAFLGRKL